MTFTHIDRISDESRKLVIRSLEIGRETEKLIIQVDELRRTARQYDVVGDRDLYDLYSQKHQRLRDTLNWLGVLVKESGAQQVLKDIRIQSENAFQDVQAKAQSTEVQIPTKAFEELVQHSDAFKAFSNTAIQTQLDEAARTVEATRSVLYYTWVVSSLFIGAFIVMLTWFIAGPIRQIDSHIRRLGKGDFSGVIKIRGPGDISNLGDRLDWLRVRLAEVNDVKEQFFREMSHQLKTPLASIREAADLLTEEGEAPDSAQSREVLEILRGNTVELQHILDNMLNFSAWRADPGKLYKERFYLSPLVDSVVQRFQAYSLARSLEFGVKCPEDLSVEMDQQKCRIILDNIISNAVKFSPDGGRITVNIEKTEVGIALQVCDEGPGIPVDERDRVFELFYTGEATASSKVRGTGIGLSLVRAYVEAHGGNVNVDSKHTGGTTVRVHIPQG